MGLPERSRSHAAEVVVAARLPAQALARLEESLGSGLRVVDITDASPDAVLILCPPCSPQTIGALRRQFPRARVVVVEVEDAELGVALKGPVSRSLDAGASAYLTAGSVQHLASMLDGSETSHDAYRPDPLELSTLSVDDEILSALARLAMKRSGAEQRPDHDGADGYASGRSD